MGAMLKYALILGVLLVWSEGFLILITTDGWRPAVARPARWVPFNGPHAPVRVYGLCAAHPPYDAREQACLRPLARSPVPTLVLYAFIDARRDGRSEEQYVVWAWHARQRSVGLAR
jgi:hypothetical protein